MDSLRSLIYFSFSVSVSLGTSGSGSACFSSSIASLASSSVTSVTFDSSSRCFMISAKAWDSLCLRNSEVSGSSTQRRLRSVITKENATSFLSAYCSLNAEVAFFE